MSAPKVSIITPSYNQARFLPETLASVRSQDYQPIEHLVLDGGSTDGSVEIMRTAPDIHWQSEPDRGQVDALNKGFQRATGEILAWLNSDDVLYPNTVRLAVETLTRTKADLVYGDLEIIDAAGRFLKLSRGIPFDFPILLYGINYIGQQTVFFRRRLLDKAGGPREEFDNGFDYELWLRMSAHGRFAYDRRVRAKIRCHPEAKSVAHAAVTAHDRDCIRKQYWAIGGLPLWCQKPPWFSIINYWYRLKRQWTARTQ